MTITVATSKLIDVLTDALQTAFSGVHLATHRAPLGDEPGDVDLLAATSSTGFAMGHTWIPVDGDLEATLWPVESTKTVITVCKSLAKKGDKDNEHTVDISVVVQADPAPGAKDDDEHPGWIVTVSETAALFDSDTEFQFHAHPASRFSMASVRSALLGADPQGGLLETEPLTMWNAGVLAPLVAVASRRKAAIRLFRSPGRRLQIAQIGDAWLGAVVPVEPPENADDSPSIEPHLGEMVGAAADLLRNGSGLVTATEGGEPE